MSYIHPNNQILKLGDTFLSNNFETLRYYGVENNCLIQLSFKFHSNFNSAGADRFFYRDIKHIREQN